MDYWPMVNPVLMISGPELSIQVSNTYNLDKPEDMEKSLWPIVGGRSMITMNGEVWKFWRGLFNPGYSASHMLSLVPTIVDSVEVFCDILREGLAKMFLPWMF
jgi:cytochrome P450